MVRTYNSTSGKQKGNEKPIIYINCRKKMSPHDAQTKKLTPESNVSITRSEKAGKDYIKNYGDITKVYVLRDKQQKMLNSYSYRGNNWSPINMGNYFGGYKIGNPRPLCDCGYGKCLNPRHPTYNN